MVLVYDKCIVVYETVRRGGCGVYDSFISSIRSLPPRLSEGLGAVEIFFWWRQMLLAVKAVHDHGIVHCDLKPQNFILFRQRGRDHPEELGTGAPILFEQYVLKLCDFGVSRQLEASATHVTQNAPIGTVRYMAPEVVHDCRSDCKLCVGRAADIWGIGIVLYQMLHLGLTPHSHVERLKHKLRLMLAIADPKSARVQSSCPRLLVSTSSRDGFQQNGSRDSDSTAEDNMRLASARHATLMGLQSACLQYEPSKRATTDHLASITEAEGRRFFSSGIAPVPLDAVSHSKDLFLPLAIEFVDRSESGNRFLERRRQGRFRRLFAWILVCVVGVALSIGLAVMLLSRKNNGDNKLPGTSPSSEPLVVVPTLVTPGEASAPTPAPTPGSAPTPGPIPTPGPVPTPVPTPGPVPTPEGTPADGAADGDTPPRGFLLGSSVQETLRCLVVNDPFVRSKAAKRLSRIRITDPKRDNTDVVSALLGRFLEDEDCWVRMEAVAALVQVVDEEGKGAVIEAFLGQLGNERSPSVRREVVKALAHIAEKGSARVISVFLGCLFDEKDRDVDPEVIDALGQVVDEEGRGAVIEEFLGYLVGGEQFRRSRPEVVKGLAQIAEKGNARVISRFLGDGEYFNGLVDHRDPNVRVEVIKALAKIAEKNDAMVIRGLLGRVVIGYEGAEIVKTLVEIVEKGGEGSESVIEAFQVFDEEGKDAVIGAFLNHLGNEQQSSVRVEVVKALAQIAEKGSAMVIRALLDRLKGSTLPLWVEVGREEDSTLWHEGVAIVKTLAETVEKGGRGGEGSVVEELRRAVVEAFLTLSMNRLGNQSETFRAEVVKALALVAEKGDFRVISPLLGRLDDEKNSNVRVQVIRALAQIAEPGNKGAIAALRRCLHEEKDPFVRAEVDTALELLTPIFV